jgi:capsular polysaccharide biosynthesis protein
VLSRLFVIKKHLPQTLIYLSEGFTPWQKQALDLFELTSLNYHVPGSQTKLLKSKELLFIHISNSPEITHADLLAEMSALVKTKIKTVANQALRKIYISRKKAQHRRVINEPELEKLLNLKYGFEIICLEDYSVEEQYQIIHSSRMIIAVHGPSLTNLIGSEKPIVIELLNNKHLVECYAMLAYATRCTYKAIACENVGVSTGIVNGCDFYGYNDIIADTTLLESVINELTNHYNNEAILPY